MEAVANHGGPRPAEGRRGRRDNAAYPGGVKSTSGARTFGQIVSLVLCGLLAGVVVAAAAFPVAGVSGLSAKSASDSFSDLPTEIKIPPLPQESILYASDGKTPIARFFYQNRQNVQLKDVAPVMLQAMVAGEDTRFYQHKGVDLQGIARAFVRNSQSGGEVQQGASTLTQQYVRQILQYAATTKAEKAAATADTAARKLREIRYAVALEKELNKQQILENYLNVVYFGNSGHGISAASYAYFSKAPSKLTLPEAALLAGLVKDPVSYNPTLKSNGTQKALDRRSYVLNQMVRMKYISAADAAAAKKAPIGLSPSVPKGECENGNVAFGFYCGWFLEWWKNNPAFGTTRVERENNLKRGGYRITGSIDPQIQAAAQRGINAQVSAANRFALGTVLVEPGTGRVKAMAINRNYSLTKNAAGRKYPYTVNPLLSATTAAPGYQAGSTFKIFTLLAALQQKKPLSHTIYAPPRYFSSFPNDDCPVGGNRYCPKNASPAMTGPQTMWSAFGESANTYFIQLEEQVTVKAALTAAEKAGVILRDASDNGDLELRKDVMENPTGVWGSFTLGTAQVSPLDMANAYATVAARGKHCDPLPVRRIVDQDGKALAAANPTCDQAFAPEVADAAADAARCPVGDNSLVGGACTHPGGGRTASRVGAAINRPIAGKSGTTDNNNAAWMMAFTPTLSGASFLANADKPSEQVPNTRWSGSALIAAMNGAFATGRVPVKNFVAPTNLYAYGVRATVPNVNGDGVRSATATLRGAGFDVRVERTRVPSGYEEGAVARTDPSGGTTTSKGSLVTIFVSSGAQPTLAPVPAPTAQSGPVVRRPRIRRSIIIPPPRR